MDIEKLRKEMTNGEKSASVAGTDSVDTSPISRLGIPSACMADGSHGPRKQNKP